MRNNVSAYEKEEMEKIHKNSGIKGHKSDLNDEENDDDEDDSDWEWYSSEVDS